MSSAMNKLNNALFKAEHKSHYSKQDVDILDEYRTVVPVGTMKDVVNNLIEIDVSKAFTSAFQQITEIPIFNEFDSFTIYKNERISLNSLYIIKAKIGNLFFSTKPITYVTVCSSVSSSMMLKLSHIKANPL